jgi:hypothetical protein
MELVMSDDLRLSRIEQKLDKLADAVVGLARMEERMLNLFKRIEKYEEKLFEYTVGELKYDRSDEEKNKKIGDKYEECLRHFFKNHQRIPSKPKLEMFIPIKIENIMFQGYVDFIHSEKRNDKDIMVVTDWKTSTIYKGEKLIKEKGQLLLYGLGIHQKLKIPYEQIIVRWAFLKYVDVDCLQANGNSKTRQIERNDIGNSLSSSVKMWLKKSSTKPTEDEIEEYLGISAQMINHTINGRTSKNALPGEYKGFIWKKGKQITKIVYNNKES